MKGSKENGVAKTLLVVESLLLAVGLAELVIWCINQLHLIY